MLALCGSSRVGVRGARRELGAHLRCSSSSSSWSRPLAQLVAALPVWHAGGQGFESPQLHTTTCTPAAARSAEPGVLALCGSSRVGVRGARRELGAHLRCSSSSSSWSRPLAQLVAALPVWHAGGQGFESPQLHTTTCTPAAARSAEPGVLALCGSSRVGVRGARRELGAHLRCSSSSSSWSRPLAQLVAALPVWHAGTRRSPQLHRFRRKRTPLGKNTRRSARRVFP